MTHPSESGHFYTTSGEPVYEVPNASKPGEFRPTNLRDAKRLGLVPSVTTILQILSKPQLEKWKQQQVLLASLTMPRPEGITEEQWIDAILDDARDQSIKAMDIGTKIHAAIQSAYEGILWEPAYEIYCYNTIQAVNESFGDRKWEPEKSFASNTYGFGGKIDLTSKDQQIIIDFKSSSMGGDKLKKAGFQEHLWQLAGYAIGIDCPEATLSNVYISTVQPGAVYVKTWTPDEAKLARKQFLSILSLWKLLKKFGMGSETLTEKEA